MPVRPSMELMSVLTTAPGDRPRAEGPPANSVVRVSTMKRPKAPMQMTRPAAATGTEKRCTPLRACTSASSRTRRTSRLLRASPGLWPLAAKPRAESLSPAASTPWSSGLGWPPRRACRLPTPPPALCGPMRTQPSQDDCHRPKRDCAAAGRADEPLPRRRTASDAPDEARRDPAAPALPWARSRGVLAPGALRASRSRS
mmetsp:Transcript_12222/g.36126  ORF Transcript_12222/g.36126 Transcript_12222/m.36126 type:complete len:200 (-) Transcript_12222:1066-1665(-)